MWPDTGNDSMTGNSFWGALVDSSASIVGEIGHLQFGYGP